MSESDAKGKTPRRPRRPRSARPHRGTQLHLDARGRARMVDVGAKATTARRAVARGRVRLAPTAFAALSEGRLSKGDALAVARLAGADCARSTAASAWLRGHGLAAPEIYAADYADGFGILEDLGDALFAEVLADGGDELQLYKTAVEVLAKIHATDAPAALSSDKPLFDFDSTALVAETDLLVEWFLPLALQRPATGEEVAEHRSLWRTALAGIGSGDGSV